MRRFLAVLLIAVVATAVHGAAATLGVSARPVGAGSAVVGRCQPPDVVPTVTYAYGAGNTVTGLTISGLGPNCDGGHLQAVVTDAAGIALAGATASVVGSGAAVLFSPPASAEAVAGYRIAIVS